MAIRFLSTTNTLPEIQINDTGNNPRLAFQESGVVSGGVSTTGGSLVLEASSGIERARILSTGQFGIGTTTPGAKLEVFNSGGTVFNVLGSLGQLFSVTDNLSGEIFAVADISGVPIFKVNSSGLSTFTGLVSGITPVNAANFVTKAYVDGPGGGTGGPFLPLAGGTLTGALTGTTAAFTGSIDTTAVNIKVGSAIHGTITSSSNSLTLNARNTGIMLFQSGTNEKMRITSAGNVGIGTTSPDAKLEIEGDVDNSFYSVFVKNLNAGSSAFVSKKWWNDETGANFGEIWRNSSTRTSAGQGVRSFNMYNSHDINFWSGGTHTMALVGNDVGIGTTSPNAKLDVNGVVVISPNTDGKNTFQFTTGAAIDDARLLMRSDTTVKVDIQANGYSYLSGGNVGIGTTSNSAGDTNNGVPKFQVTTATAVLGEFPLAARFTTASDAGDNSGVSVLINSGNDRGLMISAGRQSGNVAKATLNIVENNGTELTGITLLQNGSGASTVNTGIGTTIPLTKLHIAGATDANIIRIENTVTSLSLGSTIGAIQFFNNDPTDNSPNVAASIYATAGASGGSGSLRFKTTEPGTEGDPATDTMIVTNGGRVGIGTMTPTKDLTVGGINPTHGINLRTKSGSSEWLLWQVEQFFSQEGYMRMFNDNVAKIQFRAGGDSYFVGGDVGIGTSSPDFKLDVGGTLGVSDLPFNSTSVSVLVANETLGVELVTNGNFTSATGWNLNSNWSISGGTCNADGTSNNDINQNQNVGVIGQKYLITYVISAYTQGTISARIGNGVTDLNTGTGTFSQAVTATTTDRIRMNLTGSFIGSVSSLSIKQITSASNQIRKRELGNSAFEDTEYWKANGNNIHNTNSANVGIGTSSPTSTLHVDGSSGATAEFRGATQSTVNFKAGSKNNYLVGTTSGGFSFRPNGSTSTTMLANGNVGIGITAPNNLLNLQKDVADGDVAIYIQNLSSVVGSTDETTSLKFAHGNDNVIGYEAAKIVGGKEGDFESSIADIKGFLSFSTAGGTSLTPSLNNTERMRISSAGDVGIGTIPTVGYNLDVKRTSPGYSIVGRHATGGKVGIYNSTGDNGIGTVNNYAFNLFTNNSAPQVTIATTGKVGIGTTSPGEKLDVDGNIKIQSALLSNQENLDIDSTTSTVASVVKATYTAAFFDFVIKKGTNVRSGTVYACHNGTDVQFTETSTQDLGDTSDVTLTVILDSTNMIFRATTTSNDWSVKSLIRAI